MKDEREHSRGEFKETEYSFRAVFTSAPVGIAIALPEGRFITVNESFCQMLGYEERELQEMTFLDISHPEDREETWKLAREALDGQRDFYEMEKRYLTKNGHSVWASMRATPIINVDSGEVLYWLGIITDITERKRAEEELRVAHEELERRVEERTAELKKINEWLEREIIERRQIEETLRASEERHRLLLESSPDPTVVYDMEGVATYVNPAFVETFGWTREELLGKRIDYVPQENMPETKAAIERMLLGEKVQSFETRRLTEDGRLLDIQLSSSIFKDRYGKSAGNIVILRDITDRKRMEEAVMHMSHKLLTLQERERSSLARLLHDSVGQNISILDFNLTTIEEVLDDSSKEKISALSSNMRSVIRETGDKLRDIVRNLHPRDVQELGLIAGVSSFVDRFQRRTNLDINTTIRVNRLQLEEAVAITLYRIIQEVFTNILKHSKCRSVDFQMEKTDDRLLVKIRDDGIGFNKEEVASLEVEKRGMGLFIIQERAKAINGRLRIHSELNLGTEVQIEVPLVQS